jgi:hypothetical protein
VIPVLARLSGQWQAQSRPAQRACLTTNRYCTITVLQAQENTVAKEVKNQLAYLIAMKLKKICCK